MPDESDYPPDLKGSWRMDGTWVDKKVWRNGRREEMPYMRKHGVVRQRLQSSHAKVGGQDER